MIISKDKDAREGDLLQWSYQTVGSCMMHFSKTPLDQISDRMVAENICDRIETKCALSRDGSYKAPDLIKTVIDLCHEIVHEGD